jgi:hypothetical protein
MSAAASGAHISPVSTEAVQQHDSRSLTAHARVDCCAVGFDLAGIEGGGKGYRIVTAAVKAHFVLLLCDV